VLEEKMQTTISANPKGTNLARFVQAIVRSGGDFRGASIAAEEWRDSPAVHLALKAHVPAMSTSGAGASLSTYGISNEFIELVRGQSILGKLEPKMRKVPFMTAVARETTAASSRWIPESGAVSVAALAYNTVNVEFFKAETDVVISAELARFSSPSAELAIRNSLVGAAAKYLDGQFLDPTVTRIANERPASVTSGAQTVVGTGSTSAQILADTVSMMALLGSWSAPFWVMRASTAAAMAAKMTTGGSLQFPAIGALGGFLHGIPVIASTTAPAAIVLLDAADLLYSDDGFANIDVAKDASILMDTLPQASPQTTSLVSLWQRDMMAIRCTREVSWLRGHDDSVVSMVVSY
jgi:hypothetical protein